MRTRRCLSLQLVRGAAFLGLWLGLLLAPSASLEAADKKAIKSLKRKMAEAIHNEDESRARELFSDLEDVDDPEAVGLVLRAMAGIPSTTLLERGITSLKKMGSDRIDAYAEKAMTNKKVLPAMLAALMMAGTEMDDEKSEGWLLAGLQHKSELVQRAAMYGADKRRSKQAVPLLIDLIEKEGMDRNTVAFDARVVLISLTGRDFVSVEDWRKFWEGHAKTIDPKNLGKDEKGPTSVKLVTPETPDFFGVEIISQRVIFIIDISGSMQKWDEGSGEKGSKSWEARQRVRRVKNQLSQTIGKLDSNARFNVIAFNEDLQLFSKKGLVKATGGAKRKAISFIRKLVADRGTDTGKALEAAFQDPSADTIVLLSDGAPHHQGGRPQELIPQVEELVVKLNRIRRIKIFTLGFEGEGEWPPGSKYRDQPGYDSRQLVDFLKRLAKDHGGKYTKID